MSFPPRPISAPGSRRTTTAVAELWVGYYKKGVPKQSMTYAQAVEEALCFGWIDGLTRRIDDEVTSNRYTPGAREAAGAPSTLPRWPS